MHSTAKNGSAAFPETVHGLLQEVAAMTDNAAVLQQRVTKASNVFLSTLTAPGESQFLTALKPCGILLPHMHQRANEFYSIIFGKAPAVRVDPLGHGPLRPLIPHCVMLCCACCECAAGGAPAAHVRTFLKSARCFVPPCCGFSLSLFCNYR